MSDKARRMGKTHYFLNTDVTVEVGNPSSTGPHARIISIVKDTA